ncbi:hypothetical protein [Pedobacter sp. MW01-1-1]|uniref:hypothetical protein n=1 Tax=Pedobacter sp. MW01-1-1 TaxID=3383027 RepID=UPI003FF123EE
MVSPPWKEARYVDKAPKDYINKAYENGRRFIDIQEPEASIMKWGFQEMNEGLYSAKSILNVAHERVLKMDKNTFLISLRNPVYCGRISLPEH